jgi:hypothetical protein
LAFRLSAWRSVSFATASVSRSSASVSSCTRSERLRIASWSGASFAARVVCFGHAREVGAQHLDRERPAGAGRVADVRLEQRRGQGAGGAEVVVGALHRWAGPLRQLLRPLGEPPRLGHRIARVLDQRDGARGRG